MTMNSLPITFRRHGKDIVAVFPTEPASHHYGEMTCYSHVGQHSGCSWRWYQGSRPALPADYADLLAELRQIYEEDEDEPVKLVIVRRITSGHRAEYSRNYRRMMRPEAAE